MSISENGLSKAEIIALLEEYCGTPFVTPNIAEKQIKNNDISDQLEKFCNQYTDLFIAFEQNGILFSEECNLIRDHQEEINILVFAHYYLHCHRYRFGVSEISRIKVLSWMPFCIMNVLTTHWDKTDEKDNMAKKRFYRKLLYFTVDETFSFYEGLLFFRPAQAWRTEIIRMCDDYIDLFHFNPQAHASGQPLISEHRNILPPKYQNVNVYLTSISKLSLYSIFHAFYNYAMDYHRKVLLLKLLETEKTLEDTERDLEKAVVSLNKCELSLKRYEEQTTPQKSSIDT